MNIKENQKFWITTVITVLGFILPLIFPLIFPQSSPSTERKDSAPASKITQAEYKVEVTTEQTPPTNASLKNSGNSPSLNRGPGERKYYFDDGSYIHGYVNKEGAFVHAITLRFLGENSYTYTGPIKNNVPHGNGGVMIFSNNMRYEGNFNNGDLDGYAKVIFSDGSVFTGNFSNGIPESGELHTQSGVKSVIWENGNFVDDYRKSPIRIYSK